MELVSTMCLHCIKKGDTLHIDVIFKHILHNYNHTDMANQLICQLDHSMLEYGD